MGLTPVAGSSQALMESRHAPAPSGCPSMTWLLGPDLYACAVYGSHPMAASFVCAAGNQEQTGTPLTALLRLSPSAVCCHQHRRPRQAWTSCSSHPVLWRR